VDPEREGGTPSLQRHLRPQRIAQLRRPLDEGTRQLFQTETVQQEIRARNGIKHQQFFLFRPLPLLLLLLKLDT